MKAFVEHLKSLTDELQETLDRPLEDFLGKVDHDYQEEKEAMGDIIKEKELKNV